MNTHYHLHHPLHQNTRHHHHHNYQFIIYIIIIVSKPEYICPYMSNTHQPFGDEGSPASTNLVFHAHSSGGGSGDACGGGCGGAGG